MIDDIKSDAQTRMGKSIDSLRHDLMRLRTGRASTALVDGLKVPYYGADTLVNQVATVSLADSRSIIITPFDKSLVGPIEKAIMASDIGITPNTAAAEGENAKIAIRNVRRDALQQIKEMLKEKLITEDDERRADDDVQKLTDRFVKEVDQVCRTKEEELMAL